MPDLADAPAATARRSRRVVVAGAILLAAALVAGGIVYLTRDDGRSDEARAEVQAFLDAWAGGRHRAAAQRTDDPQPAADLLASVERGLRPKQARLAADGDPREGERGAYTVPFTARFTLEALGTWEYESAALAEPVGDGWKVRWSPSVLHPELRRHQTLVLTQERAERAPILAADGTPLAGDAKVWEVAIWPAKLADPSAAYKALADPALGAGIDIPKLKKRVAEADPDTSVPVVTLRDEVYQRHRGRLLDIAGLQFRDSMQPVAQYARSLVGAVTPGTDEGASALQARYDEQLRAAPSAEVVTADRATGQPVRTLARKKAGKGEAVRTTIDPEVQQAAEAAVGGLEKNASLVALAPGSGKVLAVADNPETGENRALSGRFPPGSTFKAVTAAALVDDGVGPGTRVDCPKYAYVDGQRFENQDEFDLPPGTTFRQAFAHSCNTAFIGQRGRLGAGSLTETARAFGIGGEWQVGAATFDGSVPPAGSENEKAAATIGQGRVEASPLVMASVAATVKAGRFRQPVLVPDAVDKPYRAPAKLGGGTARQLRALMRAVVTEGSGTALAGLPQQPYAKSGTAEFGTADPPRTHAWMIGFLGGADLAFCVLVEDGGSGGKDAGPVAAEFLRRLG